jgi:hypothetical protein
VTKGASSVSDLLEPGTLASSVDYLISRLIANKAYPKYQFERASEVFLAPFIEEWLSDQLGSQLELVAMEFPLKKKQGNTSTNADYLFYSSCPRWVLVEVKTDVGRIRPEQLEAYERILRDGKSMASLRGEIEKNILPKSKKKKKYRDLLHGFDADPNRYSEATPEIVFLTPHAHESAVHRDLVSRGFRWFSLVDMLETFQPQQHLELWKLVRRLRKAFAD